MRFWEHVRSKYWLRTSAETLASVEDQALAYHIKSTFKVYQVPVSSEAVEESRLSKCFKSCFSLNQKKVTYSINVLEAGMMEDVQQQKTIVFMHGFGLGLPFWFPNIDTFVEQGYRVIAMDWLGMGRSTRAVDFPKRSFCAKEAEDLKDSELFFIDSMEACCAYMKLSKFSLVGHSLGGYLSTAYALKYPDRVEKLVLASPVGIPAVQAEKLQLPWTMRLIIAAWGFNITPQDILRMLGPWGQAFIHQVMVRRFQGKLSDERGSKLMAEYMYHMSVAPPCGEYAMNSLLYPHVSSNYASVVARHPLESKLQVLRAKKILMLFGDRDWLFHPTHIPRVCSMYSNITLSIVRNAGHHIYADNPNEFNHSILKFLK